MAAQSFNYAKHAYLAIVLTQNSPLLTRPANVHPDLTHLGPAGPLPDIHLFSVPRSTWDLSAATILNALRQTDGVLRVDVQEPRARAKRG
ncbi:hypothetical protein BC834DRAFT_970774 [Gloeopeniophorella convolvens]|nr:hypothetical protein BC834DRAFT_970774 [Gloeopeniophorella convolvens]